MDQLVGVADDEALPARQPLPYRPLLLGRDHQELAVAFDLQRLAGLEDLVELRVVICKLIPATLPGPLRRVVR